MGSLIMTYNTTSLAPGPGKTDLCLRRSSRLDLDSCGGHLAPASLGGAVLPFVPLVCVEICPVNGLDVLPERRRVGVALRAARRFTRVRFLRVERAKTLILYVVSPISMPAGATNRFPDCLTCTYVPCFRLSHMQVQ